MKRKKKWKRWREEKKKGRGQIFRTELCFNTRKKTRDDGILAGKTEIREQFA
ncbi:MAG: hypothetical protein ACLT3D_03045 [Lawsonibacter sp.]|jgi:hypothetical protein